MTRRTNSIIIVKVDLDTSCINSHNHTVGMDKMFSSDTWRVYIKVNNKKKFKKIILLATFTFEVLNILCVHNNG